MAGNNSKTSGSAKQDKRAQALRENLKKRKDQAARRDEVKDEDAHAKVEHGK